jgi:hypothetical protein
VCAPSHCAASWFARTAAANALPVLPSCRNRRGGLGGVEHRAHLVERRGHSLEGGAVSGRQRRSVGGERGDQLAVHPLRSRAPRLNGGGRVAEPSEIMPGERFENGLAVRSATLGAFRSDLPGQGSFTTGKGHPRPSHLDVGVVHHERCHPRVIRFGQCGFRRGDLPDQRVAMRQFTET